MQQLGPAQRQSGQHDEVLDELAHKQQARPVGEDLRGEPREVLRRLREQE